MTAAQFREIVLAMDGVEEKAHLNHPDFRIGGRIFASLTANEQQGGVKLTPEEQRELMDQHPAVFTPASGAWGRQGWTMVNLAKANKPTLRSALTLAYEQMMASAKRRAPSRRAAAGRASRSR